MAQLGSISLTLASDAGKLGGLELPVGSGRDALGWGSRGVMATWHRPPLLPFRLNSDDPCKTVHIGADKYDSSLANDCILFVNTLSAFINATATKDTRIIWGTNEPSNTFNYSVLNADDTFYIVSKFSGSYPQQLNLMCIFAGNPAGGVFAWYMFDTRNTVNKSCRDPWVVGHIAAQWNEYGPNATVTNIQFVWEALHAVAVIQGQNLDKAIKSKGDVILRYGFAIEGDGTMPAADSSGNGYDGTCHTCSIL
ncbi:hypothetical protein DFH08DRAFT_962917 [Mycena albidolilacea]|uniref:Uncharacterized protein n=1 Tax=Mycena albidolilacea TaxID=1033008 RepID=A0AAD6ZWG2_9AGAR|nr:hypothetical protein DFH08DRAFT_962917 [Mycena albidolilacea]